ncbi:MAG: hypothetical protein IPJ66_02160 [Bacteroidetes bacterium]|nr:hypothetical protein [Bacteroidota bacterium]
MKNNFRPGLFPKDMSRENPFKEYKSGVCNIGVKEVSVRRKFFYAFLPITFLLTLSAFFWDNSLVLWILLLGSAFCLTVLYNEIKYKFCILFGFFSLYNFEKLGTIHEVKNPQDHQKDRKRVLEIVIQSLLFSLIYATSVHLAAGYFHLH